MKAELIPFEGGKPIRITRDVTVIGRRDFCDVVLDDPSLSKRHCVLVKTDGLLVIRDLATTNGTKVKGQKIRWAALLPEDRISLGKRKFRVYLGPDDVPSPSEIGNGIVPPMPVKSPAQPTPVAPAPASAPASAPAAPVIVVPVPRRPNPLMDDDIPQLNLDDQSWLGGLKDGVADESDLVIDLD